MSYSWKFHCAVLGVPEQASLREIKHAYRKLALRCHPDRNGGTPQAKEKFLRLNESYRFLVQNFSSMPPPAAAPEHSPPPFSSAHRREAAAQAFRREATAQAFSREAAARAQSRWLPEWSRRLRSWWARAQHASSGQNPLAYAALGLSLSIAVFAFYPRGNEKLPPIETATPEFAEKERTPAAAKTDANGRALAECELQSISIGRPTERLKTELSEHDCGLLCYGWIDTHITMDSICRWADDEFRQQRGIPAHIVQDSNAWYRANNKAMRRKPSSGPELSVPRIIYNPSEAPDSPHPPEPERIEIRIGQEHRLKLEYVPAVWVESSQLLLARHYGNPREIYVTPIREGSVSVWLMDGGNQLHRHLIFNIRGR